MEKQEITLPEIKVSAQPEMTPDDSTATESADAKAQKNHTHGKKHRKYRFAFPLGVTVLCLAVVGVIALIFAAASGVMMLRDDTKQRDEIKATISMAVNMDPLPFSSVKKADKDFLLNISAWTALNKADKKNLRTTDTGNLLLPKSDVEAAFKMLFGVKNSLNYTPTASADSESMGAMQIVYDKATNCYQIPTTAYVESVTPVIPQKSKLVRKGNVWYVKVGYSNASIVGADDATAQEESVYKYMTYVMAREKDHYVIQAVLEYKASDYR